MHHCVTCGADFEKKEQLAGHNSAHVRRGEKLQRVHVKNVYPRACSKCNVMLESPSRYGAHSRMHLFTIENINNDKSRKRFLLEEDGHRCEICKLVEWNGKKIPIELDHIDGNPDNNVRENLRLLCPNCHAQQPTHAGANARKHSGTKRQAVMSRYPSYRHHGHSVNEIGLVV